MAGILPHWPVEHLETIDEVVERYCVASSQGKSRLYVGLGSVLLGFAVIGIWIPGWATGYLAVPAAVVVSIA